MTGLLTANGAVKIANNNFLQLTDLNGNAGNGFGVNSSGTLVWRITSDAGGTLRNVAPIATASGTSPLNFLVPLTVTGGLTTDTLAVTGSTTQPAANGVTAAGSSCTSGAFQLTARYNRVTNGVGGFWILPSAIGQKTEIWAGAGTTSICPPDTSHQIDGKTSGGSLNAAGVAVTMANNTHNSFTNITSVIVSEGP